MKRLGIIAQDINSGIGDQSWEYARWLKPEKVLITDLTVFHEAGGKKVTHYPSRFAEFNNRITDGLPSTEDIEWLLDGIDVLLVIETALNWSLFPMAKERGVRTILHVNWELLDKLHADYQSYPVPDEIWLPTSWHEQDMIAKCREWGVKYRHVPVPVNREKLPFRPRVRANTFLHIAGHPTFEDRNGTEIVLAAIKLVKNKNIKFVIRTQQELPKVEDDRLRVIKTEAREYHEMFRDGDVLLLPRRYGGLSLQMQEALSVGMPVIMPDISPQNEVLMDSWLIPANYQKTVTTRPEIDIFEVSPEALAEKIDYVAALSPFTFTSWNLKADTIAHELDWRVLLPIYQALLNGEQPPDPMMPEEYKEWS